MRRGEYSSGDSELAVYCEGNDPELANCDPERSYDPWAAHGGEVHYWIRDAKTEVYPFTVIYEPAIWYGYLHLTTGERVRDKYTEDIFMFGFLRHRMDLCWMVMKIVSGMRPRRTFPFTGSRIIGSSSRDICFIGTEERVLYLNYETRCSRGFTKVSVMI